jgi:hypothetical protein
VITYSEHTTLEACEAQDAAAEVALCNAFPHLTHSSVGLEAIRLPEWPTATRFTTNPHWSYRGDNTKYRSTK